MPDKDCSKKLRERLMGYPVITGKADSKRLSILNKIYNPISCDFLKESGLATGDTVLEVGCGCGDMACWIGNYIGNRGLVVAVDQDAKQIEIAKAKAKKKNISNIEFLCEPLENLPYIFNNHFDFAYTRWTLMFSTKPQLGLKIMYNALKKRGKLICEDTSVINNGIFTCPQSDVSAKWTDIFVRNFVSLNFPLDFSGSLYIMFIDLGCKSVSVKVHQPMLRNKDDKSIFRLGIQATSRSLVDNKASSEQELNKLMNTLKNFENCKHSIIGYARNILISGVK